MKTDPLSPQDLAEMTEHLAGRPCQRAGLLSAKDVCDIISVSKKSGVLSLRLGELSIEFNQTHKAKATSQKRAAAGTLEQDAPEPGQGLSPYAQGEGQSGPSSMEELDLLMVEDPVAYERMLMDQEEPADEAN